MPSDRNNTISEANIEWQDSTPFSQEFGDVYYSKAGGLDETTYVFLQQNHLAERWQKLNAASDSFFTIAETGFGTGLNFLAAAQLWLKTVSAEKTLHFISYEKFPLTQENITQALTGFPLGEELLAEFLEKYPPCTPGFHRIELAVGRVLLTLCFGDANSMLSQTQAKVDAWFLDGFAPAKNPELWNENLFKQVAKLSKVGTTTFSTFTAASLVRKGLAQVGFDITKVQGFGRKREMIRGLFSSAEQTTPLLAKHTEKPWFNTSQIDIASSSKSCVVIGGGLAGTASAFAMAKRGWKVTLVEREHSLAQGASGNPTGVLFTKLSPHDNPQNRFNQLSFLYSIHHIQTLLNALPSDQMAWDQCGVLQLAYDEKELKRQQEILECGLWPESIAYQVDAQRAGEISGIAQKKGGLFFPNAGWVNPPLLCQTRASHPNISVRTNHEALKIEKNTDNSWSIHFSDGSSLETQYLIISNAKDARTFLPTAELPLRNLRGQISYLSDSETSRQLNTVLCYDGYTSPSREGFHCVGATFHPKDEAIDIRESDHTLNLQQLKDACPDFYMGLGNIKTGELKGRAQLRCQTPDYLPIVGPVADKAFYLEHYAPLRKGMLRRPFPVASYEPNLFVNLGHGSRGLTTSAFCAEIVASYICGEPQPIDKETLTALHPARFLVRDLKRRTI